MLFGVQKEPSPDGGIRAPEIEVGLYSEFSVSRYVCQAGRGGSTYWSRRFKNRGS